MEEEGSSIISGSSDSFLHRCFAIFNLSACQSDEDPPEQMLVFFYPPDVDIQHQIFLIGPCSFIADFSKRFTSSTPNILNLEKEKLSMKIVSGLHMVMTGPLSQPDTSLISDLDKVYNAFRFFNGTFDTIRESCSDDLFQFHSKMKELFKQLIPLIKYYDNQIYPSFDRLPSTILPEGCNRFFLMASEIIYASCHEPDNLGGCIFYNGGVLCTHFDPTTTFYIYMKAESLSIQARSKYTSKETTDHTECLPVFVSCENLKQIRDGRTPVIQFPDNVLPQIPKCYQTVTEGHEFVGLFILCLSRISMAVMMNLPAMYDERHLNKTRSAIHSKLCNLELKLHKSLKNMPQADPLPFSFNFLTYDKSTKSLSGTGIDGFADIDPRFNFGTRVEHEIFSSNPSISQISLRDHTGVYLGKRMFEKEVFYQHRTPPVLQGLGRSLIMGKDVANVEDIARENLSQDVSIHFF